MAEQNIEKILEKHNEGIKRQIGVLGEDFDSKVELIGEQYETIIEKLDSHDVRLEKIEGTLDIHGVRLEKIEGKIEGIEVTLDIMKLDLEFIKNELKQKVNRDEFAALEKRLSMLEIKFNQT